MESRARGTCSFAWLLCSVAAAQVEQPGVPASMRGYALAQEIPAYVLTEPDVPRLLQEDAARNDWPFRYAAPIPCELDARDAGLWEELPTGELVWRLRVVAPHAKALGLLFTRFELPAGGQLFVYDPRRETVLGAFTNAARQPDGKLSVEPVRGHELVVEYVHPAGCPAGVGLCLGEVVYDYRGVLDSLETLEHALEPGGQLGLYYQCLVDVNCAPGVPYQDVKRAAFFFLTSTNGCSAGLLNNTAQDGKPYFLTARHCGRAESGYFIAYFRRERPACEVDPPPRGVAVRGGRFLTGSSFYDSALWELSSSPPPNALPLYAGWDRAPDIQPGPAVCIGHPVSTYRRPKKITVDDQAPVRGIRFWLTTWELGRLDSGSSGSPLFNGMKRVIGPASRISSYGCYQTAYSGRFGGFWKEVQLEQWLDPLGLDPHRLDAFDPEPAFSVLENGSGSNPLILASTRPPSLGADWLAAVDVTPAPQATTTLLQARTAPAAGSFSPFGELLVDLSSPLVFRSSTPVVGLGSSHRVAIPNDPTLDGTSLWVQALLVGPGPITLTNGYELVLH